MNLKPVLAGFTLAVLGTISAVAAPINTFVTATGATESGGNAVNASAVVTLGTGTITVTLTNLLANPTTVAQNISDFFFTLNTTPTGFPSTVTPTGSLITVAGGTSTPDTTDTLKSWALTATGNQIHIDALVASQGPTSAPKQLIIGPGPYTNANASITGSTHNPFINGTATFTFAVSGVTANSVVSNGIFSFGTDGGDNVNATGGGGGGGSVTPEPSTFLLGGSLVGLSLIIKRVKRA